MSGGYKALMTQEILQCQQQAKPFFNLSHLSTLLEVPPHVHFMVPHYVTNGQMPNFFDSEVMSYGDLTKLNVERIKTSQITIALIKTTSEKSSYYSPCHLDKKW